jgi:CRP-like cAMP-binding protein
MASLRDHPIFGRATPAALERLVAASCARRFERGEPILSQGDAGRSVFSLERGAVRVFHSIPTGKQLTLRLFRAPAIFGEAEAWSGIPYIENVEAVETSDVLVMPIEAVEALLRTESECAIQTIRDLARRFALTIYNEKSLAFSPATMRLASFLVDYVTFNQAEGEARPFIDLTQDDMAAAIGVTRRAVAHDMGMWVKEGIVVRKGRSYRLLDLERLKRYCDSSRLTLTYTLAARR